MASLFIFRDFSAPVKVEHNRSEKDLLHIVKYDNNAISEFYQRWKNEYLVINKWLLSQAQIAHSNTLETVKSLVNHATYNPKNPNKVYSLIGGFSANFSISS